MNVTALSDTQLLSSLKDLVTRERKAVAAIVAHLAEVDARGLHLKFPAPSLTAYCIEALGYSEYSAAHRVTAARLARRFPLILALLEDGQLNLSAIRTLGPVLDDANHAARLRAAGGKTRLQVEELVAAWAPKPDVPTRIVAVTQKAEPELLMRMQDTPRGVSVAEPPPQKPAPLPTPIAPDRYTITVTVDRETRDALMKARDHLRHVIPDGDLAKVITRAVNELVERVEARKFGKRKQPAKPAKKTEPKLPLTDTPRGVSHEPDVIIEEDIVMNRSPDRATRRAVAERDGYQCCYVSDDGRRCSATAWLEYDHKLAWCLNGPTFVDNLQLLCRAHNRNKHPTRPGACP